ncbi:MAG TPA: hypothetical protein VFT51_12140 [Bacillales bacterium]|nr:hypothetical protein [Bacillales bacterium]
MELEKWHWLPKVSFPGSRWEETREFLHLYRRRGWIFSFCSLLFAAVPVYLFQEGIQSFSGMTFLYLLLSLLLAILWFGIPALFVFYNSRGSLIKRIWAWIWVAAAVAACLFWGIVLSSLPSLTGVAT